MTYEKVSLQPQTVHKMPSFFPDSILCLPAKIFSNKTNFKTRNSYKLNSNCELEGGKKAESFLIHFNDQCREDLGMKWQGERTFKFLISPD